MSECHWEPLAEINLHLNSDDLDIYCLCSRVFVRNGFDNTTKTDNIGTEFDNEENVLKNETVTEQTIVCNSAKDVDSTVSCYCSASHTDNISADEHDSLRSAPPLSRGLHSSDSGADLSESFVEQETWEHFWAHNGEKLIWTSWISKYSNYINNEFLENYCENNSKQNSESVSDDNTKFSFETKDIINLTGTDNKESKKTGVDTELYQNKLGEGWNPLSPASIDGGHHSQEDELLLSARCESVYSVANTRVTSDSMTNVTKLTLSSLEISSSSSSTTSSSSSISETFSPIQSSISSESENDPGTAVDADQYWQYLWKQHFEEQYYEHYMRFIADKNAKLKLNDKFEIGISNNDTNCKNDLINKRKLFRREIKTINSVGYLLHNLKVMDEEDENFVITIRENHLNNECKETISLDNDSAENTMIETQISNKDNQHDTEEEIKCQSNILKLDYHEEGSGKHTSDDEDNVAECKASTSKRSHESDNDDSGKDSGNVSDRVLNAFTLMGYVWSPENDIKNIVGGDVTFRKKHIRLQNRQLKMNQSYSSPPIPKHIYFDDDGNAQNDDPTKLFLNKQNEVPMTDHVLPIELISSSDDEKHSDTVIKSRTQIKKSSSTCDCNTITTSSVHNEIVASSTIDNVEKTDEILTNEDNQKESLEELIERSKVHIQNYLDHSLNHKTDIQLNQNIIIDEIEKSSDCDVNISRKRKKKKKKNSKKPLNAQMPSIVVENPELKKYWFKRFQLFSKFDQGILLDYESWFSVTPERVAKYTAERCSCNTIIDAFCGAGGNTIQFALMCDKVIAIDIDPEKIKLAKHNASIYGVQEKIEFIVGDFTQMYNNFNADVVFLSPPWGGPNYLKSEKYDLETMLEPEPLSVLMKKTRAISNNIAIFLPRNSNTTQLAMMAGPGGRVEIEQNFLDKAFVSITAFYGNLINNISVSN